MIRPVIIGKALRRSWNIASFILGCGLILLIRVYQIVFSPLIGRCCRFEPSCSRYAVEAIRIYGGVRGAWLAVWRVLRCNPFNAGGFDPVPLPRGAAAKGGSFWASPSLDSNGEHRRRDG